jgi:4,5-DOPA dioxygenase extradiol
VTDIDLNQLEAHLQPSPLMPVVFVGHGSPMNAIETNSFTKDWQKIGSRLPKPQAIVVISAHWQTYGTHITSAPKQPLIYDMYGFPDELYRVTYPADGDPVLAKLLAKKLEAYETHLDSQWGLDHGTWSVLAHLAPTPDVPVLQISLDMRLSLAQQTELFEQLIPLRQKGVLFIGSGNIVHNLRQANFSMPNSGYAWGLEFDHFATQAIENRDLKLLTGVQRMTSYRMSAPTDEHYRPLVAVMALAGKEGDLSFFAEGMAYGSISMRSLIIQ